MPYTSYVFSHCQPVRLQALAKMKGLNPPELENAKVLEIGCSFGGNLIPFALQYPHSQIVGVDLSERQIETGKVLLQEVGIDNIELVTADISQVEFKIKFDYIICHGVFSWVPDFVQEAILKVVQEYLNPNGIAFISYNTYPGWKVKEVAKELMLFGSDVFSDPSERVNQGFDMLRFTDNILKRKNTALSHSISGLFNNIINQPMHYISHEYFEDHNYPIYFREFIKKIEKYQLSYLTDSNRPAIFNHFQFDKTEWDSLCLACDNRIELIEQFVDFIDNKEFRCSVITHKENLVQNQVENKVEQYNSCYNFSEFYFTVPVFYVEKTEQSPALWTIDRDGMQFNSNPLSDLIFNYIQEKNKPIKVADVMNYAKKSEHYDEQDVTNILWHILHSYATYISLTPLELKKYPAKPLILEKRRKLIHFIQHNQGITSLSNCYFQNVQLDFFAFYISQHLDGTNKITDLMKIVRQAIDDGDIEWRKDGELLTNKDIPQKELKERILFVLQHLQDLGYFL